MRLKNKIGGAILIGGQSKRMGRAKANIILSNGKSFLDNIVNQFQKVFEEVYLVGSSQDIVIPAAKKLLHIEDRNPGLGPLAGIEAILSQGDSRGFVVTGCDQPLLTSSLLKKLNDDAGKAIKLFKPPTVDRIDPFPGYFPLDVLPFVMKAISDNELSVSKLIRNLETRAIAGETTVEIEWVEISDREQTLLKSFNTPEDLLKLSKSEID